MNFTLKKKKEGRRMNKIHTNTMDMTSGGHGRTKMAYKYIHKYQKALRQIP